jgi:hypothetical protein
MLFDLNVQLESIENMIEITASEDTYDKDSLPDENASQKPPSEEGDVPKLSKEDKEDKEEGEHLDIDSKSQNSADTDDLRKAQDELDAQNLRNSMKLFN